MSFLAPLYVLGALGIGLPILFHLIRRQPRGQRQFSSLMFLKPTPPTLTRRSRLENWPLLLLRALALLLLAIAFARPFLRIPLIEPSEAPGKRIVFLVDTSASMRRESVWQQAIQTTTELLSSLKPADQFAIIEFDTEPRILWTFAQSTAMDFEARRKAATQALQQIKPSWSGTRIGAALVLAADILTTTESEPMNSTDDGTATDAPTAEKGQIVIVSDMQTGDQENLRSLQSFSWPKEVSVELKSVAPERQTNAFAMVLESAEDTAASPQTADMTEGASIATLKKSRVRVTNSRDATKADFSLVWHDVTRKPIEATRMPVHVGPGESRVVRMPEPPASVEDTTRLLLVLEGDDHGFDNVRYVARPEPLKQKLWFIGPQSTDPRESLYYYLQRMPLDNRRRKVTIEAMPSNTLPGEIDPQVVPLVVVAEAIEDAALQSLKLFVSKGGNLLWVLDQESDLAVLQRSVSMLLESPELTIAEADIKDYSMWSKIDFSHPLFRPLADARFNDFTKIRFWSHRELNHLPGNSRTLAHFDDGSPAIVEQTIGDGRVWLLAAGWQPVQSQLALSTKFVPLIDRLYGFGQNPSAELNQVAIGTKEPPDKTSLSATIFHENEPITEYRTQADFSAVDRPGFYELRDERTSLSFAANVSDSESHTEPLLDDELERYGVVLGLTDRSQKVIANQRQRKDSELESRQRLWQWLLLCVLALLAIETGLGGFLDRGKDRLSEFT